MDALRERLLGQMNGTAETVPFDSLALEVFAYQFARNAAYRNYATARGRTCGGPRRGRRRPGPCSRPCPTARWG